MSRPSSSQPAVPRPLAIGERVELWLRLPSTSAPTRRSPTAYGAAGVVADGGGGSREHAADAWDEWDEWDIRPALVAALAGSMVALRAGSWPLALGPVASPGDAQPTLAPQGRPQAVIRRLTSEGLAEWDGHLAPPDATATLLRSLGGDRARGAGRAVPSHVGGNEQLLVFLTHPHRAAGRLLQRRRSPRVALRLTPVRLLPLPADATPERALPSHSFHMHRKGYDPAASMADPGSPQRDRLGGLQMNGSDMAAGDSGLGDNDLLPVARLTDVSLHGAGVVIDCPLPQGTPVRLEFDLPGETQPFVVHGRVIEPAVPLHGEAQPQVDGLPGFRRGIEFLDTQASQETHRLRQVLALLLRRRSS